MSKKALIIGAAGFMGGYLIDQLHDVCNWSVCVTKMKQETLITEKADVRDLDILQYEEIVKLLQAEKPDYIFHLAAQSSVAYAWKNPQLTVDININGSINVLNAIRSLELDCKVLLIGSSEEYGNCLSGTGIIDEAHPLQPNNMYAMTKVAQELTGRIYAQAYGMHIVMVRAFNHIGPKQAPLFVVSDFCKQVADIEKGLREPVMRVGNLAAKRDFTDVRDIARAYSMIIEDGVPGEIYNIGRSKAIEIRKILDMILEQSTTNITVEIDPARLRPIDTPLIEADTQKLRSVIDWEPRYQIEDTILDTLNYWREYEDVKRDI
ncbi:MAG: GDP-mannose 4,6-dehydratase [Lachnospiraceae bacterium]